MEASLATLAAAATGTHVVAKVPPISGGAGSLTDATLKNGRNSYLTASCPKVG
jgi:hypothetical protein